MQHIPVMETEVKEYLSPARHGWVFVDCTAGYGGHSAVISRDFDETDTLIGIDRDADALAHCHRKFEDAAFRAHWFHGGFDQIDEVLNETGLDAADGYLFDCGFSSPQVDVADRGFSFMREGRLDMRMDQRQPLSAYDVVNTWHPDEMADAFKRYGDERFSRKIASAIARRRETAPIESTQELADIAVQAIPKKYQRQEGIHPATRIFQAIRIVVNDELEVLRKGLQLALEHLKPGGRVAVLSYHSLEHRIVKEKFHEFCGNVQLPVWAGEIPDELKPKGTILTKKSLKPCAAEQAANPRSRSAQLRVVEKNRAENE